MTHIEAMKQALDFLRAGDFAYPTKIATDLEQAIATEESSATQEPVWYQKEDGVWKSKRKQPKSKYDTHQQPKSKYDTHQQPNAEQFWQHNCTEEGQIGIKKGQSCDWCGATEPKRQWVGLTDEEVRQMCGSVPAMKDAVHEAEAKLKEKNT